MPTRLLGAVLGALALGTLIVGVAGSSTPEARYSTGSDSVPQGPLHVAVVLLSSLTCSAGDLQTVTTQGATTIGDLAMLQPDMPGMAFLVASMSNEDVVYAAVTTGDCIRQPKESGGETLTITEGYVLFTESGPLYLTGWRAGHEPRSSEPFGPSTNAAFVSQQESSVGGGS